MQIEIYRGRDTLWATEDVPQLHRMFTPEIAAKVLGVKYEAHAGLGHFGNGYTRFEVAGLLDRQIGKIAVSQQFKPLVQRFTGAHEIGHWDLHKGRLVLHRDRQIEGLSSTRNPRPTEEREADYYAACFLVPRNLLIEAFEARFSPIDRFRFNDDEAFGLCPSNPHHLLTANTDSLEWQLTLASSIRYHGNIGFESLADLFQVSNLTMAIRLKEIGVVIH